MATESKPRHPLALTIQEEVFVFSSLMLVTCFLLPWRTEQSPSDFLSSDRTDAPFWWFLLIVLCLLPLTVRFPRVRPWAAIFGIFCVNGALALTGGNEYGAQLTRLFALTMLIVSAKPAVIQATDFAMKRLNAQKAEVSSHWGTALQSIQFSAQEFYAKVEQAIFAREWPGIELLRIQHSETGVLSHKREYLRVVRQRQVFDICAATFGKDYFFTLREAEIRPPLSLATFLIFLLAVSMLFTWSVSSLGLIAGTINFLALFAIVFFLMWNSLRMGLTRLDGLLMRFPVIGPIYETFFRRSTTYFQHDTRMVFLKLMDDLVKEQVDEETSAKGIKLLSCFEHRPIFEGFYTLSDRTTKRGVATEQAWEALTEK
jgi:hypothetical protein